MSSEVFRPTAFSFPFWFLYKLHFYRLGILHQKATQNCLQGDFFLGGRVLGDSKESQRKKQ